jgi:nicotinate phosphoribosyltransferase
MKTAVQNTAEGVLFTDQYQLTMAQLYYRVGLHEKVVQFDYFFRDYPDYGSHRAGYCINAGLEWFLDWLQEVHFREEDIEYLRGQKGRTGTPVFDEDFLNATHRTMPSNAA